MDKISREDLVSKVATILKKECLEGSLSGRLPGSRLIATRLGVSPPTVLQAFKLLESDGVIYSEGVKRGYTVADLSAQSSITKPEKRSHSSQSNSDDLTSICVLVIGPSDWDELPFTVLEIVRKIRNHGERQGYSVVYESMNMVGRRKIDSNLDRLIHIHKATHLLLARPTENVVFSAAEKKLPYYCLGGDVPYSVLKCDVSLVLLEDMIHPAVVHLASHGHTRFLCPMQLGREPINEKMWDLLLKDERIHLSKADFESSFPLQDLTQPDCLLSFWVKEFSYKPPTAVIIEHFTELLSFYQFCNSKNLSIPEDVSVVALFDDPALAWLSPSLTRFVVPTKKMTRLVFNWISRNSLVSKGAKVISPQVVEGSTVKHIST